MLKAKRILLIIFIIFLAILTSNYFSRREKDDNNFYRQLENDANFLHSEIIKIDEGLYFIVDNRQITNARVRKEMGLSNETNIIPKSNGKIVYGYLYCDKPVQTPTAFSCTVRGRAYVKAIFEYGTFRFLDCTEVSWSAMGSNVFNVDNGEGAFHIDNYGKYLVIEGAFNVSTDVPIGIGTGGNLAGWEIDFSTGKTIHLRKWVRVRHEFNGDNIGRLYFVK